jgi:hypothetical protein
MPEENIKNTLIRALNEVAPKRKILREPTRKPEPQPEPQPAKPTAKPKRKPLGKESDAVIPQEVNPRQLELPEPYDVKATFYEPPTRNTKKAQQDEYSHGVAVGELDMPFIGVAFPSFCWEMFTCQSVLPAEACYVVGGPTGSYKSHFALEMASWIAKAGGVVQFIENEVKYNPDMAQAVMGKDLGVRVWTTKSKSFTQVQDELTAGILKMNEAGQTTMLQIVDSIVGNATKSKQEKVKSEGHSDRDYPDSALAAANFLPSYLPMLANRPYYGAWITHYTEKTDGAGIFARKIHHLKGGGEWEYRVRMAFILKLVSPKVDWNARAWSVNLRFELKKAAGIVSFRMPVTVRSSGDIIYDEVENETLFYRKTRFCWDEASVAMLLTPENYGYPTEWKTIAKDILGLEEIKIGIKKCVIAPKIGITQDSPSRSAKAIMDALYADQKILDSLRANFGIAKGILITPGSNYTELVDRARRIAARRLARLQSGEGIRIIQKADLGDD